MFSSAQIWCKQAKVQSPGIVNIVPKYIVCQTYRRGHCKMQELQISKVVDLAFDTDHNDIGFTPLIN